jgi:tetratricopeptide (TPR) repeat protein
MKRIACGVLVLLVCDAPGWGQGREGDGNPRRIALPATTEASRLQWLMMTGSAGSSSANGAAPSGIVSVETLKVPGPAMKEMQKFLKDFDAGKLDSSVKHLSKAIEIYPEWAAAHYNLGQTYARMGSYDKAILAFQSAAELDSRHPRSWLGLSKVYFIQKRYAEGETAARRALEIDPVNGDAKYFLARNLISKGQETSEALQLLEKSKEQYAAARLVLANIYLRRGAVDEAVTELRGYIAQPDAERKEKVQCMVRKLTEPEGTVNCVMN